MASNHTNSNKNTAENPPAGLQTGTTSSQSNESPSSPSLRLERTGDFTSTSTTTAASNDTSAPAKAAPSHPNDRPTSNSSTTTQKNHGFNHAFSRKIKSNDAYLIRSRSVSFNQRIKQNVELLSEEKVSKYKLEEVHCSIPSSMKSTFIMTFSPDGQRVASTHGDHRIYICDLNTGKLLDTLDGHPKTPWSLAWHPSNREILASGCLAGEVRVWDLRTKACESWTSENNTIITSLDFHPKERILVIATANDIHFWDWSESEPFARTTTTHDKEKVKFVLFDSSGTKLITGISNLPKFAGYSSDSLQHRIIDSYLTHGNLDHLPTENMTQSSEITSPLSGSLNSNDTLNERESTHLLSAGRPSQISAPPSNEQDLNYRSTLNLSRVAFLYRQLEALEDSMRHTSFSPYINSRPINSSIESQEDGNLSQGESIHDEDRDHQQPQQQQQQLPPRNDPPVASEANRTPSYSCSSSSTTTVLTSSSLTSSTSLAASSSPPSDMNESSDQFDSPPISNRTSSQGAAENLNTRSSDSNPNQGSASRTSNTFEPFVVSFDESLEHIQLSPLTVDGQVVHLASLIEQYPIGLPYQLHYMMQFESMNQVNQNFIRISKLMSSVRLYRQIVQQILSSNSGSGYFQPNQILTAQTAALRPARTATNLPIVFRNFPVANPVDNMGLLRGPRATDPIMAIQFRNSARNVPLGTICKIDLLAARSICITRSQQIIEQTISSITRPVPNEQTSGETNRPQRGGEGGSNQASDQSQTERQSGSNFHNIAAGPPFFHLLNQLHQSLTIINHAPLTTSTVHSHITSLRGLLNKLLTTLSSMFQSQDEGQRLVGMIHDIAHSLTGRRWSIPLGVTIDDIRLDVIHALCIVDLTLHLTRQVQLLQMQRLSAVARIEESQRTTSANSQANISTGSGNGGGSSRSGDGVDSGIGSSAGVNPMQTSVPIDLVDGVSSSPSTSQANSKTPKRKDDTENQDISGNKDNDNNSNTKKMKLTSTEGSTSNQVNPDTDMIDLRTNVSTTELNVGAAVLENRPASNLPTIIQTSSSSIGSAISESLPADRLVIWNNSQTQSVEQSLQRFLVAATSNMSNSHILVRIYHRLHGNPSSSIINNLESSAERLSNPAPPSEYRRRALSQDNHSGPSEAVNVPPTAELPIGGRARQIHVHYPPGSMGAPNALEAWLRNPHLHVYQTRGAGQHLWFNQWTIPLPMGNSNYRLQCWNFSTSAIPNIKDVQSNIVTQKCRIHNDSSIDLSSDGRFLACLVPREDETSCMPNFDLTIYSLRKIDFGACYYRFPHGPNAISVSLSPSASYAVVGLASHKFISNDPTDDELTIAKVFKINGELPHGYVRDIKIKKDDSSTSLNAIRWMPRGIVYNVGPQPHQRYQRMRNRVAYAQ